MIQIIDGFRINASVPIDSRFVVENETERDNITNKYHGLRVWVTDTNTPWYWNGTDWKKESEQYISLSSGTINTIPKFTGVTIGNYNIGNSQITDNGDTVSMDKLDVSDTITFNSLVGDINNIGTDKLNINRLQPAGVDGQILTTNTGVATWTNINTLTIGTADNAESINVQLIDNTSEYTLVLRNNNQNIGNYLSMYTYNNGLKLKKDSSGNLRILAHDGSDSNPPYSFYSSQNTGMYSPSSDTISFSTNKIERVRIDGNGLKTILGSVTSPSITSFSTQVVAVPGGTSLKTISNTGFYFNSRYSGSTTEIIKEMKFTGEGTNTVSFNRYGLTINKIGTSQYPSISFRDIDTSPNSVGIYSSMSSNLSFVTGNQNRFIITGDSSGVQTAGTIELFGRNTINGPSTGESLIVKSGSDNTFVVRNDSVTFGINSEGSPRIRTGNNTSPTSPSFTWYDNDQTGIYRPSQDVIGFSTSGVLRLKIEDDGTTVNNNFYLPSPNGSTPTAGKILTAVDGMGKSEWSSLYSNFIQTGFHRLMNKNNVSLEYTDMSILNSDNNPRNPNCIPFVAPFDGYYQITMNLNIYIDVNEDTNDDVVLQYYAYMTQSGDYTPFTYLTGVRCGLNGNGLKPDKTLDRFWYVHTLTWAGQLQKDNEINVRFIKDGHIGRITRWSFYYMRDNNGSHLSWIGIKST